MEYLIVSHFLLFYSSTLYLYSFQREMYLLHNIYLTAWHFVDQDFTNKTVHKIWGIVMDSEKYIPIQHWQKQFHCIRSTFTFDTYTYFLMQFYLW